MGSKIEEWRDVPEYEGYYQVSSLGRVRSLDRTITYSNGREQFYKGAAIEGSVFNGYRRTCLKQNNKGRTYRFSQLVAMAFLEHKPNEYKLVVDHINGDKSDDRVENLRIVTHRANLSTCFRSNEGSFSSEYIGVFWNKGNSKWKANIKFNGKPIYLGYFADEIDASICYQSALSKVKNGSFNPDDYKPKWTSKYKGVCLHKRDNKWIAQISRGGKSEYIGAFTTEIEAYKAYLKTSEQIKQEG